MCVPKLFAILKSTYCTTIITHYDHHMLNTELNRNYALSSNILCNLDLTNEGRKRVRN